MLEPKLLCTALLLIITKNKSMNKWVIIYGGKTIKVVVQPTPENYMTRHVRDILNLLVNLNFMLPSDMVSVSIYLPSMDKWNLIRL